MRRFLRRARGALLDVALALALIAAALLPRRRREPDENGSAGAGA